MKYPYHYGGISLGEEWRQVPAAKCQIQMTTMPYESTAIIPCYYQYQLFLQKYLCSHATNLTASIIFIL